MDPVRNPYTPSAGSRPHALAGREAELEQFRILIARLREGRSEQSMIAKGLRGVGKTVLLNAFEDIAEDGGFLTYYLELTPESSLVESLTRDCEKALRRLSLSDRVSQRIRAALSHLRTIKLAGPDGFGLEVSLGGSDEGTITADLTDLFLEVGQAVKENDKGVAFFLDEVQFADEVHFRAMISALHRSTQKRLPITAAAAGLPQIPRLSGDARSYAERLFTFPTIDNLTGAAARAALIEPAAAQDVEFDEDAVGEALAWTDGYPFFIQQLGKHAWNGASDSPISLADVESAKEVSQDALDASLYEVRIQRATERERDYMRAMAELGGGPYRSGDVAGLLGRSTSDMSPTRQSLLDKGLVYATEDYGFVDFTVPRFDDYMRRYMPFDGPETEPKDG